MGSHLPLPAPPVANTLGNNLSLGLGPGLALPARVEFPEHAGPRSFEALDERLLGSPRGTLLVQVTGSANAPAALGEHVARRLRTLGRTVVMTAAAVSSGTPMFRDVASRLGIRELDSAPDRSAAQLAHAANAGHVAIVLTSFPEPGSWDSAVARELTTLAQGPLLVMMGVMIGGVSGAPIGVAIGAESVCDLAGEPYEVSASLSPAELTRFWAAVCGDAPSKVPTGELEALDHWWSQTWRRGNTVEDGEAPLAEHAHRAFGLLALLGRAWPIGAVAVDTFAPAALRELLRVGACSLDSGWLSLSPLWSHEARAFCAQATPAEREHAANTLRAGFPADVWALVRAAELLLQAGLAEAAEDAHVAAQAAVTEATARKDIVGRWRRGVALVAEPSCSTLRVRAAERALARGEAEEARAWAEETLALGRRPEATRAATLVLAQALVAMGDLVAARAAFERLQAGASPSEDAIIGVELAELAYLSGNLPEAAALANRAHVGGTAHVRLKGRNVLGKLLLAEGRWDEADHHFAEDTVEALASGEPAGELRARLNRGIALLSKGGLDEARAMFKGVLADGEQRNDARACAFALANLSVVAAWQHDYATALKLAERTLLLSQHIGDRMKVAQTLATVAELRLRLGLFSHAAHAVAFGRRTLGPGIPPARAAHLGVVSARIALARGQAAEADAEITRAVAAAEADGGVEILGQAYRVAVRVALEDGALVRARGHLSKAQEQTPSPEAKAETTLLAAKVARAAGEDAMHLAREALALTRSADDDDLTCEALGLLAELYRVAGALSDARSCIEDALRLGERSAASLPDGVRDAFLARPDNVARRALGETLGEAMSPPESAPEAPSRANVAAATRSTPRELVGDNPAIRGLHLAMRRVARVNSTVLVRGESGTGKELVAEGIHRASDRASGPLVTVNCAALVETLLLSELFGHEKGAFTGAIARRRGRFELAEGGTLFLDEIGDISARTQVALLRVLQERTFERVGGTTPIRVNVRIVCATHRDLRAMVDRGEFREDLYYRLRGITLEIPPLRQRLGDVPRIAEALLARIAEERGEQAKTLAPEAVELLQRHRWAGNVRELENALRAATLFVDGGHLTAADFTENVDDLRSLRQPAATWVPPRLELAVESVPESLAPCDDVEFEEGAPLPALEANATAVAYAQVRQGVVSLSDMKRTIERDCIARALAETRGNITRAAALLGMKRPRLSQLVKQYGLMAVSSEGT